MVLLEFLHVFFEDFVRAVDHEGGEIGQAFVYEDAGGWIFEDVEDLFGELLLLDGLVDDRSDLFADLSRTRKHREYGVNILLIILSLFIFLLLIIPLFLIISKYDISYRLILDHSISNLRIISLGNLRISQENGLERMIICILNLTNDEPHLHIFHLLGLQLVQIDICVLGL